MFHFSDEKIAEILNNPAEGISYYTNLASSGYREYRPLFFTPYRSGEFSKELYGCVGDSLFLGTRGLAQGIFTISICAALIAGSLLLGGVATLTFQTKLQDDCLRIAFGSALALVHGLILAVGSLLCAALSLPYNVVSLATRSVVTLLQKNEERKQVVEPKEDLSDERVPELDLR